MQKDFNTLNIILAQDLFVPALKSEIARFPTGFRLNSFNHHPL